VRSVAKRQDGFRRGVFEREFGGQRVCEQLTSMFLKTDCRMLQSEKCNVISCVF